MPARPAFPRPLTRVLPLALAAMLAACAPDAVKKSTPFDDWTAAVARACNYQTIGRYQVGSLLGMSATDEGMVFLDQTSRLYFGRMSPEEWSVDASSALNGRPGDPGVTCVLAQLPKR